MILSLAQGELSQNRHNACSAVTRTSFLSLSRVGEALRVLRTKGLLHSVLDDLAHDVYANVARGRFTARRLGPCSDAKLVEGKEK
jgi:hypothetical protein